MRIDRSAMKFNNVISSDVEGDVKDIFIMAQGFRNQILKSGLYTIAPLVYKVAIRNDGVCKMTLFLSLNMGVTLKENNDFSFDKEISFDDGLSIRHYDMETSLSESYKLLQAAAEALNVEIDEDYYHIHLNVYGESMADIYAPIIKDNNNA